MSRVAIPPPRAANNGAVRPKLGRLSHDVPSSPRIVLNAVEGWGKTTCGAGAPRPAILMSRGETGYVTLRQHNRVPDAQCVELERWPDVLATIDDIAASDETGSIVIDALGGMERLCHEHVCARDFNNDWGERGFGAFQKGYDVSVAEWLQLLVRLDRVRTTRHIPIIILSHSKIRPFKNPLGSDFDRYIADCHEKTWSVTHKWADAVFFGTFVTVAVEDKKSKRTKGLGGDERVLYTTRRDAYDAKNRYGMPAQINMPDDPAAMWSTVWDSINGKGEGSNDEPPAI